jgi:hypothetical protein
MARTFLLSALLALVAAGCASGSRESTASTSAPSRPAHLRCLSESAPGADRPLFFLFCVQSP